MHHGSLTVSLKHVINGNRLPDIAEYVPVLDSVSKCLKADLFGTFTQFEHRADDSSPWHNARSLERSLPCSATHRICHAGPEEGPSGTRSKIAQY